MAIFEISYEIEFETERGPLKLWLPLPQTAETGYQRLISPEWRGNATQAGFYQEPSYAVSLFYAEWTETDNPRRVSVTTQVAVTDRWVDLSTLPGQTDSLPEEAAFFLKPTPSLPTDGIVRATARRITAGLTAPLDKAQAIYDWVVDNTYRDPNVSGCGLGDIKAILESGHYGGKCVDLNSLFVALSRAAGIPAREVYGLRVAESTQFRCLGKSGDVSQAQHCRAEFYLDGIGWAPVDPADVRKVMLEEKLTLTDPRLVELRQRLFGYWEMNWVGFNYGRDFKPTPPTKQALRFFMYPYAETASGMSGGVGPGKFRYRISAGKGTAAGFEDSMGQIIFPSR
jgi:transglutaminase-like putative cysteine protease